MGGSESIITSAPMHAIYSRPAFLAEKTLADAGILVT